MELLENNVWMKPTDMHFKIISSREVFLASGANILFDTRMGCKMIVIVRANGEAFPASLTPISGSILMDMSHMFGQTTLA